jgi:hypothetical protein
MDKTNFFFSTLPFNTWAHVELELDVLGVHEKLVKYVVHSFKRKN